MGRGRPGASDRRGLERGGRVAIPAGRCRERPLGFGSGQLGQRRLLLGRGQGGTGLSSAF